MNKFRGLGKRIQPILQAARDPEKVVGGFTGGIVLNDSPQVLKLHQSPDLDKLRPHKGGLQQDHAISNLGSALSLRVQALGEHRFVLASSEVFSRIFRAYRQADTFIMIESWDGNSWNTEHDSTTIPLADVLVDWISFFDYLLLADGDNVIIWDQSLSLNAQNDEFTTANSLTAVGNTVNASIVPAGAYEGAYEAFYKITITGPCGGNASIEVSLEHSSEELKSTIHPIEASTTSGRVLTFPQESMQVVREITSGQNLTLKLKAITQDPVERNNTLTKDTGTPLWKGNKTPNPEPTNDLYTFHFEVDGSGGDVTIGFYGNDGGGWVEEESGVYGDGWQVRAVQIANLGAGSSFGLHPTGGLGPDGILNAYVTWGESFTVAVHGFNLTTDGDPEYGVKYQTEGAPSNTVNKLDKDPGAPTDYLVARYLGYFNNRVIALQVDGDKQKIAGCINGDPTDWVGEGSFENIIEGIGDPVDELMAVAALGGNVGALFRYRSIMRLLPTGNVSQPIGWFRWIDKVGTESPFSVEEVGDGVMFFGHDKQVYYLTESEFTPVGQPIQDELEDTVVNLANVEAVYDTVDKSYILCVPSSGTNTVVAWRFDVQAFLGEKQIVWHRNTRTMNRPILVKGQDLLFIGADYATKQFNRDVVASGGYWNSPTLNKEMPQADYTLVEVTVRYLAEAATTLIIEGSGDGGDTWVAGYTASADLTVSGGVQRARQHFSGVTGPDLRFRIRYPSDAKVLLLDTWEAQIIQRGEVESE